GVSPRSLIFQDKKVTGFWLVQYMKQRGMLGMMFMVRKVSSGLKTAFATTISKAYALDHAADAMQDYTGNMSDNKVAFKPPQAI
ncbi:hypothetical protein As57867_008898, partial [Aphanomyces stellatus]